VVSAYNPGDQPSPTSGGGRVELGNKEAAELALTTTVRHLTSDRVRRIEERLVAGDPAAALIDTAGDDRRSRGSLAQWAT